MKLTKSSKVRFLHCFFDKKNRQVEGGSALFHFHKFFRLSWNFEIFAFFWQKNSSNWRGIFTLSFSQIFSPFVKFFCQKSRQILKGICTLSFSQIFSPFVKFFWQKIVKLKGDLQFCNLSFSQIFEIFFKTLMGKFVMYLP